MQARDCCPRSARIDISMHFPGDKMTISLSQRPTWSSPSTTGELDIWNGSIPVGIFGSVHVNINRLSVGTRGRVSIACSPFFDDTKRTLPQTAPTPSTAALSETIHRSVPSGAYANTWPIAFTKKIEPSPAMTGEFSLDILVPICWLQRFLLQTILGLFSGAAKCDTPVALPPPPRPRHGASSTEFVAWIEHTSPPPGT